MVNEKNPEIRISNCQIKSVEKLRIVAQCLDTLEKEVGIHTVKITLKNIWVCRDIQQDLARVDFGRTTMERRVLEILDLN